MRKVACTVLAVSVVVLCIGAGAAQAGGWAQQSPECQPSRRGTFRCVMYKPGRVRGSRALLGGAMERHRVDRSITARLDRRTERSVVCSRGRLRRGWHGHRRTDSRALGWFRLDSNAATRGRELGHLVSNHDVLHGGWRQRRGDLGRDYLDPTTAGRGHHLRLPHQCLLHQPTRLHHRRRARGRALERCEMGQRAVSARRLPKCCVLHERHSVHCGRRGWQWAVRGTLEWPTLGFRQDSAAATAVR